MRRKQVRLQIITLQSASIDADGDVSAIDPSARSWQVLEETVPPTSFKG